MSQQAQPSDAATRAASTPASKSEAPTWQKSVIRDYFEAICIAVVFALFVRTFVVQAFKIPSSSMEDNLLVGDHIVVNKFSYGPRSSWMEGWLPYRQIERGDVLVFKYPLDARRDFIKRVIGLGGDTVEIRQGKVIRNGEALDEPFTLLRSRHGDAYTAAELARDNHPPRQVSPGVLFMMGDNRLNSEDSRFWGTVPEGFVRGKAVVIYWSFDVPDHLRHVEAAGNPSPMQKGESLGYTLLHFFDKTRWARTAKVIR